MTTLKTTLQIKRDTAERWAYNETDGIAARYIPKAGEPCYEIDTQKLKIGDGIKMYKELDYVGGSDDLLREIINNAKGEEATLKDRIDAVESGAILKITTDTTTSEYANRYIITQGDEDVATINIPKDMVVTEGIIVPVEADTVEYPKNSGTYLSAGTYIKLTIANKESSELYINVTDLLDDKPVEGSTTTTITVTVDNSTGKYVVSATLNNDSIDTIHLKDSSITTAKIIDKSITKDKLSDDVQESLNKAGSAIQEDELKIHTDNTTIHTSLAEKKLYYYGDADIEITPVNVFKYSKDTNSVKITGLADKDVSNIVFPYEIEGLPVTYLNMSAFSNHTNLTNVIIPTSVTTVFHWVFSGCTGLESITIPESVTMTGDGIFTNCTSLTNITIPDDVKYINESMFANCTSLTSITIPDDVSRIYHSAFSGCTGLTNITIPDNVTSIGESAFNGCTSLTNIIIPDNVTTIERSTFSGCTALKYVTIPDSTINIDNTAFENCLNLTIICSQGSFAETYAKENNIPYKYTVVNSTVNVSQLVQTISEETNEPIEELIFDCGDSGIPETI